MSLRENDTSVDEKAIEDGFPSIDVTSDIEVKEPPDGGWVAWLIVFGCFCGIFATQGFYMSWGVLFSYYNEEYPNQLVALSWIGSLLGGVSPIVGPFYAWLSSRMDDRYIVSVACVLSTSSLMLASISHEIWQLYICIGVLTGFGTSLMWYPCMQRPLEWFSKRRSLATGVVIGSLGVGGLTFSNVMTACLETIGYAWCLRVLGFLQLALGGIAAILCKPLNRPTKGVAIVDFALLRNKRYVLLLGVHFIGAFAFGIPGGFLPQYAQSLGVDTWSATNMNGVLSACMSVGSIVVGYLGDHVGLFNMTALSGCLVCLFQLTIWLTATNSASLWAFAVAMGIAQGGINTLVVAIIPDCVNDPSKRPAGTGWALFMWTFGLLLGQPLASAIVSRTDIPDYRGAIIFSAMLVFTMTCLVVAIRVLHSGWHLFKRV